MHSPEPWKAIPYSGPAPNFRLFGITSADGKTLYAGVSGQTVEQAIANLERIVAAVNFCRGISTEAIKKLLQEERDAKGFIPTGADWIRDIAKQLTGDQSSPPASQQPG